MDINAIEGLIENIEKLAVAGAKIAADGKVDLTDLPAAVSLLSDITEMVDNFKKAPEAIGEIKDIDAEEAIAIVKKLYEAGKKVEAALA
jgi:hypothetical protein